MEQKERLIDLILSTPKIEFPFGSRAQGKTYQTAGNMADHLIANGVIAPPCKVGDTVYVITNCENILMYHDNDYFTGTGAIECPFESSCDFEECNDSNLRIFETMVKVIHCEEGLGWTFWCEHLNKDFAFSEIGTTVFLTEEEAKRALAERSNQNGN